MKVKNLFNTLLVSLFIVTTGCGSGKDDNDGAIAGVEKQVFSSVGTNDNAAVADVLTFNVSGTTALLTLSQSVSQVFGSLKKISIEDNFTTAQGQGKMHNAPGPVINFISIDTEGKAHIAASSKHGLQVAFSVIDPAGTYVYLAVPNTPFFTNDDNTGSKVGPCALYRVTIEDNSYKCIFVKTDGISGVDPIYPESLIGNRKPIQFDEKGDVYFVASSRLYKLDPNTLANKAVTPDGVTVLNYSLLPSGDVVYADNQSLKFYKNGESIVLYERVPKFFGIAHSNTILWSGVSDHWTVDNALYSARILETGGISQSSIELPGYPDYLTIDEEGNLFILIGASVYQVVPYNPVPVARISSEGGKKIIISNGSLYYINKEEVLGQDSRDLIKVTMLEDSSVTVLLGRAGERYKINRWQKSGNMIYFIASDIVNSTFVTGQIDTFKVKQGRPVEEYLTLNNSAPLLGKLTGIKDVELPVSILAK